MPALVHTNRVDPNQKKIRLLLQAGFTEYESRILHELFINGYLTAPVLSERAKVPSPKVYQTFEGLKKKGKAFFIDIKEDVRPKKFGANIEKLCEGLAKTQPDLVEDLKKYYIQGKAMEFPEFWRSTEVFKVAEEFTLTSYKMARREIKIISGTMAYLFKVYEGLQQAREEGVKIKVLFPSEELIQSEKDKFDIQQRSRLLMDVEERAKFIPSPKTEKGYIKIRFFDKRLLQKYGTNNMWLHGSIIDPPTSEEVSLKGMVDYKGSAIFTIEQSEKEKAQFPMAEKPVIMTKDSRFIMVLNALFEFLWRHCSRERFEASST